MTVIARRRDRQGGELLETRGLIAAVPYGFTGTVSLTFAMPAAGGGKSDFEVEILSGGFGELARKMVEVNPEAALRAFGEALALGAAGIPED